MAVYVDDAFEGNWGKWTGGGHMQADSLEELHAFAERIGMRRSWFQTRPGRPEKDHYDLTQARRVHALAVGAIPETVEDGTLRRRAQREAQRAA